MRRWAVAAMVLVAGSSLVQAEERSAIGKRVADFKLLDHRGKEFRLADFSQHKVLVIAFVGVECPLAKLYGPRLARMAEELSSRGVGFVGIDANSQDSVTAIAGYAKTHKIAFPILKDLGNRVADQMAATRTPEVFVLDAERVIRYQGRIDDQYGIGFARDKAKHEDLKAAIEDMLAGRPVQNAKTEAVGCLIGRQHASKEGSSVTFAEHIAPLLNRRCVECHRKGDIAPFALTSYTEASGWADTIGEVVAEGRMPPWHADPKFGQFANDRQLTKEEKDLIQQWVKAGAPKGDLSKAPAPPTFTEGWQLQRPPDAVVKMRALPYSVPAEGVVRYQYFIVDSGFAEDKWIEAMEVLPGNRAVVHHILVFARGPMGGPEANIDPVRGFLAGYVPGLRARPLPAGMAKRVPARSKLVFQIHYTPNGSAQVDQSKIGFWFTDASKVNYEVRTTSAFTRSFRIPPGADNHGAEATSRDMPPDAVLLGLMPHMHVRGKSFRYEAVYPDGKTEVMLDVARYDFNWQTSYRLREPKPLPQGTRMHCVAHFDNSEANLNNPDPKATVRWGDQTWNEMMIGYFDIATPRKPR